MKALSSLLLGVSIVANIAMLAVLAIGSATIPGPVPASALTSRDTNQGSEAPTASATKQKLVWGILSAGLSPTAAAARLKDAALPPALYRAAVRALVSDHFAVRRAAIRYPSGVPYWKQEGKADSAAMKALIGEEETLLKSILGSDASLLPADELREREWKYGWLPPENVALVERIQADYAAMEKELMAEFVKGNRDEANAKRLKLQSEMRADLQAALTPAELETFNLRHARSASRFLTGLRDMDLTEAEYASIFRRQLEMEELNLLPGPQAGSMERYHNARNHMDEAVRAELGDARYFDYLKGVNPDYSEIAKITAPLAVSPAAMHDLLRLQYSVSELMTKERSLPPNEQARLAAQRIPQLRTQVVSLLGTQAADAYVKSRHGQNWLVPRNPATPPPPASSSTTGK